MIEIVAQVEWEWKEGFHGDSYVGRVSECRSNGITFYVRERLHIERFHHNSGVGVAIKTGRPYGTQVLDLCAPPDVWATVAQEVQKADALNRPVLHHRLFTIEWAKRHLDRPSDRPG